MIDVTVRALLEVSNALLIPDIVILLYLLVRTLLQAGGVAREAIGRRREGAAFRSFVRELKSPTTSFARPLTPSDVPRGVGLTALALDCAPHSREKHLHDLELIAERTLGRLHFGIRLGPVLGLAGTLIPLGPALVGLSSGDLASFSDKLAVAFATAVLGMFVGGVCFALHSVRRRWYDQDLSDIEFVLERLGSAP